MNNYFQANRERKHHISVGAVVLNEENKACVHHFDSKKLGGYWANEGLDDFYLLMRETMHPNETLEGTLRRGLIEEFGIEAELVDYIGSIKADLVSHTGVEMEKTTLYFLTKFKSQDLSKRDNADIEGETDVEWHEIDFLIDRMEKQEEVHGRSDVNEAKILKEVKNHIKRTPSQNSSD